MYEFEMKQGALDFATSLIFVLERLDDGEFVDNVLLAVGSADTVLIEQMREELEASIGETDG